MLTSITLKNFKRFQKLNLSLKPLTLLTGLNGMGKSSVIQSLLVLRQSEQSKFSSLEFLDLMGDLVELGTGRDVLFDNAEDDELSIDLSWQYEGVAMESTFSFGYIAPSDRLKLTNIPEHKIFSFSSLFNSNFQYLCAERLGPRKSLQLSETRIRNKDLGKQGEFVSHILLELGNEIIDDARSFNSEINTVKSLTEIWLQKISPGVHFSIEAIPSIDAALASFTFDRSNDVQTAKFRPTNIGFGISFVLPVITACLIASPGDLLIIENPEAHIHPRGQTQLGELIARTVASGCQVIIETHSDHILNGIRIATCNKVIKPEQVAFHYFEQKDDKVNIVSPQIDKNGRLDIWPEGFFDEYESSLARLIAPPKNEIC